MTERTSPVKTGERVIFIVTIVFIIFAGIGFGVMEYVRLHTHKLMFPKLIHYNLTKEGDRGMQLFFRKGNCTDCHRALNSGTNMGPEITLDGEGSKRTVTWIYNFLREPEKYFGAPTLDHGPGKAAAYVENFPPDQLHAIAVFLSELKADQGSTVSPVPPKGRSPFIENMVKKFAPKSWQHGSHGSQYDSKTKTESGSATQ